MNLFSIIIPAFNRESLICQALDSVRAQTYRPIEIIVVDDGSTDATAGVVREWAEAAIGCSEVGCQTSTPNLKKSVTQNQERGAKSWELGDDQFKVCYFYQENAGAGAARNRGIQEIHGQYVQFLDSDDRIHPDRLNILAETFEKEQCDFIQTGFEGFDAETGEVVSTHYGRLKHTLVEQALIGVLWPNTLRAAYTAELIKKTGSWNTHMTCFEDYEYVIRALIRAHKPYTIRDVLASARRGGSERISDRLKTHEGRGYRIHCEEVVGVLISKNTGQISSEAKLAFVSRIYGLGVRSYASGWRDHWKRCGEIVKNRGADFQGLALKSKWFYVWALGPLGGFLYRFWNQE